MEKDELIKIMTEATHIICRQFPGRIPQFINSIGNNKFVAKLKFDPRCDLSEDIQKQLYIAPIYNIFYNEKCEYIITYKDIE
jgi:hypothetical protein